MPEITAVSKPNKSPPSAAMTVLDKSVRESFMLIFVRVQDFAYPGIRCAVRDRTKL